MNNVLMAIAPLRQVVYADCSNVMFEDSGAGEVTASFTTAVKVEGAILWSDTELRWTPYIPSVPRRCSVGLGL